jgi:hypothetical protein
MDKHGGFVQAETSINSVQWHFVPYHIQQLVMFAFAETVHLLIDFAHLIVSFIALSPEYLAFGIKKQPFLWFLLFF